LQVARDWTELFLLALGKLLSVATGRENGKSGPGLELRAKLAKRHVFGEQVGNGNAQDLGQKHQLTIRHAAQLLFPPSRC